MGGIVVLCVLIVALGAKGFTRDGLPFSSKTTLTGRRGRVVGAAAIAFGVAVIAASYIASADRERLNLLGLGVFVGVVAASYVRGWR